MEPPKLILVSAATFLVATGINVHASSDSEATILQYVYDASGNRIKRTIIPSSKSPMAINGAVTDSIENFSIIATPNPTTGLVNVELSGYECESELPLGLYSLDGGCMLQSHIFNSLQLDLTSLPSGWYIIRIHVGEIIKSVKILKMLTT